MHMFLSCLNLGIIGILCQQHDPDGIQQWFESNRVKLSVSKSKCMLIGLYSKLKNVDYNSTVKGCHTWAN